MSVSGSFAPPVILASGSKARTQMLTSAGVPITVSPARVDESEVKASLQAEGASASDVAEVLAEIKAMQVSRRNPGTLVIGADQMLEAPDGAGGIRWLDKATSRDDARQILASLRGETHRLISCAVIVRDGQRLWHHMDAAKMTMRPFSDAFLDHYLDTLGEAALETVGGYHLEGLGAQLFSRMDGNFFTILGLPLLPLLGFLRAHGVLVD